MSKPIFHANPVAGTVNEIMSGTSALHMPPAPLPEDKLPLYSREKEPDARFLSETDAWVMHAMEHFRAALAHINRVSHHIAALEHALYLRGAYEDVQSIRDRIEADESDMKRFFPEPESYYRSQP